MAAIYHITTRDQWRNSVSRGEYAHDSLKSEGFIHSSTCRQVLGVANARFRGRDDLVLLHIETDEVTPNIRYESPAGSEERYPHIYGPLNLDAVKQVIDFPPSLDGTFALPAELQG